MKNLKNFIAHVGTLIASVLMIVFLTQAHVTMSTKLGVVSSSSSVGGFGLNGEGASETMIAAYAFVIIAMIIVSLLVILSILNILTDFNVIKENKVMSILNIVLSALALVSVVIIFGCVASEVAKAAKEMKDLGVENICVTVGFGAILDLILGIVLAGLAIVPFVGKKSK